MVTSKITHKTYDPERCVYIANTAQCYKYLATLGEDYLYDVVLTSKEKKDSLVFVFPKCQETKRCKELWDRHEL